MADTVEGTQRLLEAMARSTTRRLVLASSLSVYDWSAVYGVLTEGVPLDANLDRRDGYAIAKISQERLVRNMSREHNWDLTVLRPGFIWGRDHGCPAGLGLKLGRCHLVIGPTTQPPLTYVENCADCFAHVVENPSAAGATFNVIDGHEITSWRYLSEYVRRTGRRGYRIPVSYTAAIVTARLVDWINRRVCQGKMRLPGMLIPSRLQARFQPVRVSTRKLEEVLRWGPPLGLSQCLHRAFDVEDSLSRTTSKARVPHEHQNV
jgi:UDP-glucose 4-epimerase